jgi:hypothetical protein
MTRNGTARTPEYQFMTERRIISSLENRLNIMIPEDKQGWSESVAMCKICVIHQYAAIVVDVVNKAFDVSPIMISRSHLTVLLIARQRRFFGFNLAAHMRLVVEIILRQRVPRCGPTCP